MFWKTFWINSIIKPLSETVSIYYGRQPVNKFSFTCVTDICSHIFLCDSRITSASNMNNCYGYEISLSEVKCKARYVEKHKRLHLTWQSSHEKADVLA